jgi:hypothetical protein
MAANAPMPNIVPDRRNGTSDAYKPMFKSAAIPRNRPNQAIRATVRPQVIGISNESIAETTGLSASRHT